jgi:phospholipid transport system substrate-binding protein
MHRLAIAFGTALVLTAVTSVLGAAPAGAGEPTDQLRQRVDRVINLLQDPKLAGEGKADERRAAVRKVANEIFDFRETAQRALGPHWRSRTPAEQDEFARLFADLLEHSYLSKIEQYGGEKVAYSGESIDADAATVRTKIQTPKGSEIPVDYRMLRADGHWRVYDVVIEGVSLVGNYRTQFNKIIQTGSYEDLVQKLRSRALAAPGASPDRRS